MMRTGCKSHVQTDKQPQCDGSRAQRCTWQQLPLAWPRTVSMAALVIMVFFSSDTPPCHSSTSAADREVAQNRAISICASLGALNHTQPRTQKRAGAGEFFLSVPLPDLCCLYPQLHPAGKPMPIPFPHPHSWNISPEPSPALGVPGKVPLLLKQRRANSRGAVVFSPVVWD